MRSGHLFAVAVVMLVSGCTERGPTSPSPGPSAPLPASIEMVSASAPAGTTLKHTYCEYYWDYVSCFEGLQFTFAVRANQDARFARVFTEFRTSDGRACAETLMDTFQPVAAGVVATFQTAFVHLKPDCSNLLPFQTVTVLARVMSNVPGVGILELMKQEFPISYTFVR